MSVALHNISRPLFSEKATHRLIDLVTLYIRNMTQKSPQKGKLKDLYPEDVNKMEDLYSISVDAKGEYNGRIFYFIPKPMLVHLTGFVLSPDKVNDAACEAAGLDVLNILACNAGSIVDGTYRFTAPRNLKNVDPDAIRKILFPAQVVALHWFGHISYLVFGRDLV